MPMARDASTPAVPDGWRVVRLGEVAEVIGGSTPSRTRPDYWGGAIPWVVPSELTKLPGRYLERSRQSVTGEGLRAAGLRILPAGSTLLTSRATIGATAINAVPVTTNQGFQSLVPGSDADSLWLFYCVSALGHELQRRGAGSTFREVSRDGVRTIPILLPPLSEQRGIAAVLDAIDDAIERSEAVIAATEELRRSLLHELLSRGVPGWHSEWREVRGLGVVPACWEVVRLGEVAEVVRGVSWSREQESAVPLDDAMPVVRIGNVQRDGFRMDDTLYIRGVPQANRARGAITERSLVMVGSNGNRDRVGNVFLSDDRVRGCLLASFLIRIDPIGSVSERFLAMVLRSARIQSRITESTAGSTGLKNLSLRWLRDLPFLLPPLTEQQRIATILDSVDSSLEQARMGTDVLRSVKASASEALLSGRVRVRQNA